LPPAQVPLPPTVPLLFRIDSPIKSSQQVVMAFLHGRLVGEGNVLKHLQVGMHAPNIKRLQGRRA
jgi:hypothetical protein